MEDAGAQTFTMERRTVVESPHQHHNFASPFLRRGIGTASWKRPRASYRPPAQPSFFAITFGALAVLTAISLTIPFLWRALVSHKPVPSQGSTSLSPLRVPSSRPVRRAVSIYGRALYAAEQQVDVWCRERQRQSHTHAVSICRRIAGKPSAIWLGEWETDPVGRCAKVAREAASKNALYQIVLYSIPNRDRGGFSAGGKSSHKEYLAWVESIARGLGLSEGIVIFEPDALAHSTEMPIQLREQRLRTIREAVQTLVKQCPNVRVYIDAGHPHWLPAKVAAEALLQAGVMKCAGFAINVSNAASTDECYEYGMKIVKMIHPDVKFVVDTSRNGAGFPKKDKGVAQWANNPSLRLGDAPTTSFMRGNANKRALDALLWVKSPGESDGQYNGGPKAGQFWPDGALRLIGKDS